MPKPPSTAGPNCVPSLKNIDAVVERLTPSAASSSNSTSFAKDSKLLLQRSADTRRNFALCGVRSSNRNDNAQTTPSAALWGQIGRLTKAERLDRKF